MVAPACALLLVLSLAGGAPPDPAAHLAAGYDLGSWVRHYDIASYNPADIQKQHLRTRRETWGSVSPLRITLRGHGRVFRLLLYPDSSVFADDAAFESTGGPVSFDTGKAYTGTLEDDEQATVHGIVTSDGLFDGTIHTATEDFHVEPARRHPHGKDAPFHSIIYMESHVEDPRPHNARFRRSYGQAIDSEMPVSNRTPVDLSGLVFKQSLPRRTIVAAPPPIPGTIDPSKTTCMLYLQADHQFHNRFGSTEACIEVMTRHVQRVNVIYRETDFDGDGRPDNITFMVKRVKVHTADALKDPAYRFPDNYGVEKFLELFSEEDYDAFCLAYMFTYRDFELGTLGLAWTGDLKNAGGVCERHGHYRGSLKSLNTGIVTLLNYGKHVPPAVSHVTLAHEIGHNFGSPHDPEQCAPGGEAGNYIMFARATGGDKRNNNRFSPCSLRSIAPVLGAKARQPGGRGCFEVPRRALCGNGVVEEGEECDCGWADECRDRCCHPMRRRPPPGEPPCRLRSRAACSPSQGPCCGSDCRLRTGDACRGDNGCRAEAYCDGRSARCPPSQHRPNRTLCHGGEAVCYLGECTGSICLAYGLESCQCQAGKGDSTTRACELCCRLPGRPDSPCRSSFDWNEPPYDVPDTYAKPGTPCRDYQGYCDVFQVCREVDPSGPLATLRKLLLSQQGIASFRRWLVDYWYAVAAIVATALALLFLSTKYLGKRSALGKARMVTVVHGQPAGETVARLAADPLDGATVHPAVRSKLPLRKRVRKRAAGTTPAHAAAHKDSPRKKKRVSAPVAAATVEEHDPKTTTATKSSKQKKTKKKKKKKRHREVVDYSSVRPEIDGEVEAGATVHRQATVVATEDPVGKVQLWLRQLPKSRSTPAALEAARGAAARRPARRPLSRSVASLPAAARDKLRLQVLYRPPFKFSVRLRRPDKGPVAPQTSGRGGILVRASRRVAGQPPAAQQPPAEPDDISCNVHTVQSDLEVLLSDGEPSLADQPPPANL